MNILMLYEGYDEYTVQLWSNIKKKDPDCRISLLTTKNDVDKYKKRIILESGEHIYAESDRSPYLPINCRSVIRSLPRFDVIHITYMELKWGILARDLRRKCNKLVISVGGGDLYEASVIPHKRYILSRIVKRADIISSENTQTKVFFDSIYGKLSGNIPHNIVRFGVDVIDAIKDYENTDIDRIKKQWGLPIDRIIVMLGHNGAKQHQHMDMIDSISRMDQKVIDKCHFVIPMTYALPYKEYRSDVEDKIRNVTDHYTILDEYLNVVQMAEVTMVTDIMVHVQTTDQLSSTMMAHLYNGNVVIAGAWLPYDDIKEAGIVIYDVSTVEDLAIELASVVVGLDKYKQECKNNKEKVYKFSSWEYCADKWMDLYNGTREGV